MTDEELAEKYAGLKRCAHCYKTQNCLGEENCTDFDELKQVFLEGLKVGRDRAEIERGTKRKARWRKVDIGYV